MNIVGVKTPPTAPDPNVAVVASDFEDEDDGERLPKPIAAQGRIHRVVAVAGYFRMHYRDRADDQAAEAHLEINRPGQSAPTRFSVARSSRMNQGADQSRHYSKQADRE